MQRDRWRALPLVREAVRNVADVRARLFPALVLAVVGGSAVAVFAGLEAANLQHQLGSLQGQGRLVLEISSTSPQIPAFIDRRSCEALTGTAGVERAGIVVPEGLWDVGQLGANVPVSAVSRTLFPELDRADALVGSALREPSPDFLLTLPAGLVGTGHVMPEQPKGVDTNSAILVGLGPEVTTGPSCRVVLNPFGHASEAVPRVVAALKSTGAEPIAANSPFQDNIDPVKEFLARSSRYLPLLLGTLGGFAAAVIDRVRLSEFAAYRLSGTSGRSLAVLILLEQLLLCGAVVAATSLAALVVVAVSGYPASVPAVVLSGVAAGAVWVVVATLLTLDVPLRRPTDLAKDR